MNYEFFAFGIVHALGDHQLEKKCFLKEVNTRTFMKSANPWATVQFGKTGKSLINSLYSL